jgi:glycosyltransferase involved in cell wall biosynthesis
LLRSPPTIIANSQCAKRNAQDYGVESSRIHVLSNVIDLADFDRKAATASHQKVAGPPAVFVVCRLVRAKRLDRFLAALRMANQQTELNAVIVGDGPEREALERQAREDSLIADRVRFLGRRNDIPGLLQQADMLAVSSDHEGFPNVLLEAMAARLPIVTTCAGDASAIVKDGETGFTVSRDDVSGLAARMVELARHSDLRNQLGAAGRRRVEQKYSIDSLSERLFNIYRATGVYDQRAWFGGLLSS